MHSLRSLCKKNGAVSLVAMGALGALSAMMESQTSHCQKSCSADMFKSGNYESIPDQPKRFANAKIQKNQRYLNIDSCYDPSYIQGKTVLLTGGNRGLGLAIAKELIEQGAKVIITTRSPMKKSDLPGVHQIISGIDVTDDSCGDTLVTGLAGRKIDVVINNAGYFYGPSENLKALNMPEELKMIDICALGPLRITAALKNANLLRSNASKVIMITSQGGSIAWRFTQNPSGGDYGHHMSKAAANMMGVLVSQELKSDGIQVGILHPGFNKTDMTSKYAHIWEVEGAVCSSVGAKRTVHEICQLDRKIQEFNEAKQQDVNCLFVNCEDGKIIPW